MRRGLHWVGGDFVVITDSVSSVDCGEMAGLTQTVV